MKIYFPPSLNVLNKHVNFEGILSLKSRFQVGKVRVGIGGAMLLETSRSNYTSKQDNLRKSPGRNCKNVIKLHRQY